MGLILCTEGENGQIELLQLDQSGIRVGQYLTVLGKEPDKEYKGTFNIRIAPELHKRLAVVALMNGDTLNVTVEKAITEYVSV